MWWLASALLALAVPEPSVLVARIADDNPREALRARGELLKAVAGIRGLRVAPLSRVEAIARAAHFEPLDVDSPLAAALLGRAAEVAAVVGGSVGEANGRRVLRLSVFDRSGALVYKRTLDLDNGQLASDDRDRVASALAAALGLVDTPHSPSRVVVPRPTDNPGAARELASPEPEASPALAPDTAMAAERARRFEDAVFLVKLGIRGSLISASLVDDTQGGSCASGAAGCLGNLGSNLYPGVVGRLETFPFHARLDWLAGLGLAAGGSFSQVRLQDGSPRLETAHDFGVSGEAVYRLRLGLLSGAAAIFSPSVGIRTGVELRSFEPADGRSSFHALERLAAKLGGEVVEPLGHALRLILTGSLFLAPMPGGDLSASLESRQTVSAGFGLSAELQARLGPPNASGFTGALRAGYASFDDCFEKNPGAGCDDRGQQRTLDFDALVGWAFY